MKNIPVELQILGLTQGANLPLERVRNELCPECPFKTPFCEFMLRIHMDELESKGITFVCKGMRHWTTKSN